LRFNAFASGSVDLISRHLLSSRYFSVGQVRIIALYRSPVEAEVT
jgi:hypothetical protein